MAPGAVFSDRSAKMIACSQPRTSSALRAAGLRFGRLDLLAKVITTMCHDFGWANEMLASSSPTLVFTPGDFKPRKPFLNAKPTKKDPNWLVSWRKFNEGDPLPLPSNQYHDHQNSNVRVSLITRRLNLGRNNSGRHHGVAREWKADPTSDCYWSIPFFY